MQLAERRAMRVRLGDESCMVGATIVNVVRQRWAQKVQSHLNLLDEGERVTVKPSASENRRGRSVNREIKTRRR